LEVLTAMGMARFLDLAEELEMAGLRWMPEIGDEVSARKDKNSISVLVDPQGLSPDQLRAVYLWLPSVEQMVLQFEARQAVLFHAGLELGTNEIYYKTIVQSNQGAIEARAENLRLAFGMALRGLLMSAQRCLH
jgi:hypothetical protein